MADGRRMVPAGIASDQLANPTDAARPGARAAAEPGRLGTHHAHDVPHAHRLSVSRAAPAIAGNDTGLRLACRQRTRGGIGPEATEPEGFVAVPVSRQY